MMTQSNLTFTENHEIPEGYKKTEVGFIPENWNVVPLMHISEKIMVGIASSATHAYRNKGIPLLRNQNIKSNKLDDDDIIYISEEYEKGFFNKRLKEGDLLTARTGYPGTTCLVPKIFENAQSFTTLITRLKSDSENPIYLSYFINSEKGQKFFTDNQIGGGQKNVNAATLKRFPVIVPPLNEQQKIATVLSDTDALISELEKLIEKKQAIKTATMQQLLTGKTRLPEFALREDGTPKGYKDSELGQIPEDWDISNLGTYTTYIGSGKTNTRNFGEFPLYGSTGIIGSCSKAEYTGNAILVARVGANAGKLNAVNGLYGVSDNTIIVRLNNDTDLDFIKYMLIRKNLNKLVFGSGQPLITGTQLRELSVLMPVPEEQIAIANILKNIDIEIDIFKSKLNKLNQIKQGMMQELLTGKTRLV